MERGSAVLRAGEPARTEPAGDGLPARSRGSHAWLPGLAVLVVALLVAGLAAYRFVAPADDPITAADVNRAVEAGIAKSRQEALNRPPDAATAYQKIMPSLVSITTSAGGRTSSGSGTVVNASGAVMTALHVVQGGAPIRVRFADGTQAAATIATARPDQDIAVLTPAALPSVVVPAVLGGGARVGDAVFPVGDPLGLTGSLSAGVVSALGRTIGTEGGRTLSGLIQFDAAVNPGNSGGPLLDRNGQVIGVVTGLANPARQPYFVGIGFAVPIETAGGGAGGPQK